MWKPFISALAAGVLLQGCAAVGGNRGPGADSVLKRASPVTTALTAPAATMALEGKPPPPAPEVQGRNAEIFARATGLLLEGRLAEAEPLLLEVTADQPELAGPWVNLAQVYLAQGREDQALAALEQSVAANPANCAARTELGVLQRRRGDFTGAEAHYLACLEYRPDYEAAHLNLGILYELYLGRLAEALAAYRRYQSLATEPDRRVGVWVVDLERRLGS